MQVKATFSALVAAAVLAIGAPAHANNLLDSLKSQAGNYAMPAMGQSSIGNAAGVLQYCVKNNYLSADAAGGVKDKLMGMITGQKQQQTGYANGAKGMLMGDDGKSLNLKGISGKLKTKACDYVLKNAASLV
ncbi:DUF2501 domain-containing protein [Variovorax sp. PAMC 28711]|uniref:DUF2501 domain-containing protein n=1 Tax=Variovorax sp. PAMC 28711 TaxID=1795631 RepID=UPI00078EC44A|nr:DUF2501 domain-containing protein [Variovorax sp. PAMC 28711]AMM25879.1 hypothetical protein AX767_17095 [Variovorax sp. PAMC 28711]